MFVKNNIFFLNRLHIKRLYFVTGSGFRVDDVLALKTTDEHIATAKWNSSYRLTELQVANEKFEGKFRVDGHFLGKFAYFSISLYIFNEIFCLLSYCFH